MRLTLAGALLALLAGAAAAQTPSGPGPAGTNPPASGSGAARVPLRFEDALRRALAANLGLGRARAEVSVASAQKRGALSLVLPRLGATGGLVRNDQEVSFGNADFSRVILPRDDWNLRLTLNQPVFAGLREKRQYDQAKEGVRAAEQGVRITEDRVLLRSAADYLAVVEGDALFGVAQQTLSLARDRLKQAKDFFEAGESTRVDVLRAESAVKAAERQAVLARRQRDAAAGQLRIDLDLDGDFEVAEPPAGLLTRADEAVLLQRAQDTRGDVAQARSALRVAELEVSKQKGAYLPTITADAGYVWQKTSFPTDRYGWAALRFNVPIFQAGEIGSRVKVAAERERQARLALQEAVRGAEEDVRRALLDLGTAETALSLSLEQLAAVEAEYAQVADLYRGQEATSLDIQSSEASLADARRAVGVSRLGKLLAELGVQFASGDLKSAVLKEAQP
jgi:outer membrane protein